MKKFTFNERLKHINISFDTPADEFDNILEWCDDKPEYEVYYGGVYYQSESDLTAFLLKWS